MDIKKENFRFFRCDCGSHGLTIVKDDEFEDPLSYQIEISLWNMGKFGPRLGFYEKIRWCWAILFGGGPWNDSVILTKEQAVELGEHLIKITK